MIGGYATAARWNRHYSQQAQRYAQAIVEIIEANAAQIERLCANVPDEKLWDAWCEWRALYAKAEAASLYSYDVSHNYSHTAYSAFKRAARGLPIR